MPLLFSPLTIKTLRVKNRIVMPPMVTNYGLETDRARAYYGARARGGAGLVIVEATPTWRLKNPDLREGLRLLAETIHAGGAAAGLQLVEMGYLPKTQEMIAPSDSGFARAARVEEIEAAIAQFGVAAAKAREAGFDIVGVHGARGYFTSQFFSPGANRREDAYGGDLQRRMAFGLGVIGAMRAAVGPDFPLTFRFSALEYYGGPTLRESAALARALEAASVDLIDVCAGHMMERRLFSSPTRNMPMGTHAHLAAAVKREVSVPVIAVGRINTPEVAERILASGQADLVAIGRQLFCDADWPRKVQEGRADEIIACKSCNKGCAMNAGKGQPIYCITNPLAGREYEQA